MVNMMLDLLPYVLYALLLGFAATLFGSGLLVTILYFRYFEKNQRRQNPLKFIKKYENFFGQAVKQR